MANRSSPREHIEEIRRTKFSIGGDPNPLTEDLHQAVKNLSAELYAKDVHFLMELIQNAEDNEYEKGLTPSLEFVVTSKDITSAGAPATMLIFNNERGFSPKNIDSICSVGRSTKKGQRQRGYIGEKGIGFKSVFLITSQPYIFSNGYHIRFDEQPCSQCNVGYIVPEWVEDNSMLGVIKHIYGSGSKLPSTIIVLPLKPDKVQPVKNQLSCIHPEILLFLAKIRRLSVREDNEDPKLNTVSAIAVTSEANFITRKDSSAESYLLHLSADEKGGSSEGECSYHMWRQRFPVKEESRVERRMEVDEWVITLAFPIGERLHRGSSGSSGIYAFLPTEMVTNFPFIIQADFLLVSSRETILLDNKWNQGILDCVPLAFVNAFTALVKGPEGAPASTLSSMFSFLPVNASPFPILSAVRESIRKRLKDESIIPCESYTEQKIFQKPYDVGRLMPAFWTLLNKVRKQGISLSNISSHGRYILSSAIDRQKYNDILNFLGVEYVGDEWYAKCIQSSDFISRVSEDVYLEFLLFLAEKWNALCSTSIVSVPLLKYVDVDGDVSLFSVNNVMKNHQKLLLSRDSSICSWLINWNKDFRCAGGRYFLPKSTQYSICSQPQRQKILDWLQGRIGVYSVNVNDFAILLGQSLGGNTKLVVSYAHFLYQSFSRKYLSEQEVISLCRDMPLVNHHRQVVTSRSGVIVPSNGSKWVRLISSNPWICKGYVELWESYVHQDNCAGVITPANKLLEFLENHAAASDVPYLPLPDAPVSSVASALTKQNAFLLLDWIQNSNRERTRMPKMFSDSIRNGHWLKVSLSGIPACRPPSQSFLLTSSDIDVLQNRSVLVDIPVIDVGFYGDRIYEYKDELRMIGVMFEFGDACQYIGNHLMSLANSSTLTRGNVQSILNFIRFLREKCLPPDSFIRSIKEQSWLRTSMGLRSPMGSVLYDDNWRATSRISNIPFVAQDYGDEILSFREELRLLGVIVGFNDKRYKVVVDNLKDLRGITLTAESLHLVLECIRHLKSCDRLVGALKDKKCIRTNMGNRSPTDCFLFDSTWGCLLQVFDSFPLIEEKFYGSTMSLFKNELNRLGVIVNFEEATRAFIRVFKHQASLSSIRKEHVYAFLQCYRKLKDTDYSFPFDLSRCINEVKWVRTRLGDYRSPKECILFGPDWESISTVTLLPFLDDSDNHYGKGIHDFKKELESMGVLVAFRNGAEFVAAGLRIPRDSSVITPAAAYSLLDCIKNSLHNDSLVSTFSKKLGGKWILTHAGYRSPDKCLLYSSDWEPILMREDGPFINENFYGCNMKSFKKELKALGVVIEKENGCSLLASHLQFHSDFNTVCRIYNYLSKFNWEPSSEDTIRIWIPKGIGNGEWTRQENCVIHDKNSLFANQLIVLEKHYEKNLLGFFSNVLGVRTNPSLEDYCKLWKSWEDTGSPLSESDCCSFWGFVVRQWSAKTEKVISENLLKLPVYSGSNGILLFDKHAVFIADDLYLKHLFEQSSSHPLFVWYPRTSIPSLPRGKLLDIYRKIGVATLSESAHCNGLSVVESVDLKPVKSEEIFIVRGLFKLILGFLADPSLEMEVQKRHEALTQLLDSNVLQTVKPITISYSLSLSSSKIISVCADRMLRWDKENSELFHQKLDNEGGHKKILEYVTCFSQVISEGLLWEKEDYISQLAELIKLGFFLKYDEAAIDFLMKTKNLEIYSEDEDFLTASFPSN